MLWLLGAWILQDSIPDDFQGWSKEGAWKWKDKVLTAGAQSVLARTSWSTLCRDPGADKYTLEVQFKAKPDPAQNVLIFLHFQKHDAALNVDFEKGKPRASLGMACTYTDQGAAVFYETLAKPLEGISFKDWVSVRVAVGADEVQVFLNDKKVLESDLSDLFHNQDTAAKEPYSKRIHRGIGLGIWNQSSGGTAISVEFRNFKITPGP
jgi:hypothetical protein